jgi:hypothetical protein
MNNIHATIHVEARVVGKRKPVGTPWDVALPPAFLQATKEANDTTNVLLLRHLLDYMVREEVQAFRLRQQERRLLHVLSSQQMSDAASTGKITMGASKDRFALKSMKMAQSR